MIGWWKNNICRKSRFDDFINEANLLPNIDAYEGLEKIQRIRWSKCVVSLAQDIKDITSRLRVLFASLKEKISDFSNLPDEALKNYLQVAILSTEKLFESYHHQSPPHIAGKLEAPVCISIEESMLQYSKDDTFVVKLFKVVSDDTMKCIQWLTNDSFTIEDSSQFVKEILPVVFQRKERMQNSTIINRCLIYFF